MTSEPNFRWSTGTGGWMRFDDPAMPGPLYVRFASDRGARLFPVELYLDGRPDQHSDARDSEISPETLRTVASWLPKIRSFASSPYPRGLRDKLSEIIEEWPYGPDLSRLASYFAMGRRSGGKAGINWITDSRRAQQGELPQPDYDVEPDYSTLGQNPPPLPVPTGTLTDAFLHTVEDYYAWCVAQGLPPAVTMAAALQDAGFKVKPQLVHNWLYRGRKRGIISAAGKQGAVS